MGLAATCIWRIVCGRCVTRLIRGNSVRKNKGKVLNMYGAFVGFVAVLEDGELLLFIVRRRGRWFQHHEPHSLAAAL